MNPNDFRHDLDPPTEQDLRDEAEMRGYFWLGNPRYGLNEQDVKCSCKHCHTIHSYNEGCDDES